MKKTVSEFEINDLLPIGLTFVVTGVGIAYGLSVMSDMKEDFVKEQSLTATCNNTFTGGTGSEYSGCGAEYNASVDAISGVAKIPKKLPLIATVVVAALIIGILVRYLMVRYA